MEMLRGGGDMVKNLSLIIVGISALIITQTTQLPEILF
jgi:hypothetical protein